MGDPVRRCSSPSSFRISVPEAALLPRTLRPMPASKASTISGGNPPGKVWKAVSVTRPVISQWPVAVSLPALFSAILPQAPSGRGWRAPSKVGVRFPRPRAVRFGMCTRREARTCPRVSLPVSPKAAASGASPTPRPSHTTTMARRNGPEIPARGGTGSGPAEPGKAHGMGLVDAGAPRRGLLVAEPGPLALRVLHGLFDDITPRRVGRQRPAHDVAGLPVADRAQRARLVRVAGEQRARLVDEAFVHHAVGS